jgi:hypothetical protein
LSVEIEKPFPVEVVKKLEIPVPKPYPVHVVYYKHISEDDPPPKAPKMMYGFTPYHSNKFTNDEDYNKAIKASQAFSGSSNKFVNDEEFNKAIKASQAYSGNSNNYNSDNFQKSPEYSHSFQGNSNNYNSDEEYGPNFPKFLSAYKGKFNDDDFPSKKFKLFKANTKNQLSNVDFSKAAKLFCANGGKFNNYYANDNISPLKGLKLAYAYNENANKEAYNDEFPPNSQENSNVFDEKPNNKDSLKSAKYYFAYSKSSKNQISDEDTPQKSAKLFYGYSSKTSKHNNLKHGGEFSPKKRHEHRFSGY